jgi:hypothetical protein
MTPATKYFIKERQKWATQQLVLKDVKQVGGGMDLFEYCALNHSKLSTNLGLSLLLEGEQFSLLIDPADMRFLPIRELRTEIFYRHAMKN